MKMIDALNEELKTALKAQDKTALSVIRLLLSDIKYASIEAGKELDDEGVFKVIKKSVKKHKDSIEMYEKGNRMDLAGSEREELEFLEKYLPEQPGEDEIRDVVLGVIKEIGAKGPADMGKVMSGAMGRLGGADGRMVNKIAMELLKGDKL